MLKGLFKDKAVAISIAVIAIFVAAAVFAPLICALNGVDPFTYHTELLSSRGLPQVGASWEHWFGIEPLTGRDLFAITVYGAQTSLLVGLGATVLALFIGVIFGLVSGYLGGLVDSLLSRFNDVMLTFPGLIFMIAIRSLVPDWFPKVLLMVLIIGLFGWSGIARIIRSDTLRLKSSGFVEASRAIGISQPVIIFKHIFPNLLKTVIIFASMSIPATIGSEAALSFLGLGISPPTPSWGRSISDAMSWIYVDPAYLLIPGIALFLITLAFNQLGDGLRDAFDPAVTKATRVVKAAIGEKDVLE